MTENWLKYLGIIDGYGAILSSINVSKLARLDGIEVVEIRSATLRENGGLLTQNLVKTLKED